MWWNKLFSKIGYNDVCHRTKMITYYLKFNINKSYIFFKYQTFNVSPKWEERTPDMSIFLNFALIGNSFIFWCKIIDMNLLPMNKSKDLVTERSKQQKTTQLGQNHQQADAVAFLYLVT